MFSGDDNDDGSAAQSEDGFCEECREDKPRFFKIMTDGSAKRLVSFSLSPRGAGRYSLPPSLS